LIEIDLVDHQITYYCQEGKGKDLESLTNFLSLTFVGICDPNFDYQKSPYTFTA
jgi:hypothetical protein